MWSNTIHPVILSGGSGSRLWPLSRASYPKQLLPLNGPRPMVADTVLRTTGEPFAAPLVVCNESHRFIIDDILRSIGVPAASIILEPVGRGTAAAVAVAALTALESDPDACILVMPSDHVITDQAAFLAAVRSAHAAARAGHLTTFGIAPTNAETGYGYIQAGPALKGVEGAFAVTNFREKPDAATAAAYVAAGNYSWNSGIFLFPAKVLLEDLAAFAPAVLEAAHAALAGAYDDLSFRRLDAAAFATSPDMSIDVAVMEHTGHAAMVPVAMGWSDVGSWTALWEIGQQDDKGNVLIGDALARDTIDSYVRSAEGRLVAVDGVSNLVVVATADAVLVTTPQRAQHVRDLVREMEDMGRPEVRDHPTVHRPWGTYTTLDRGDRFQVKQIMVKPGKTMSLQYHHHRAEHWIVVEGTAKVTCGDREMLLQENESTYISIGTVHRLENPGVIPLRLIEVQSGPYLGEDDIVRLDDAVSKIGTGI